MGAAKRRGNFEERKAQSVAKSYGDFDVNCGYIERGERLPAAVIGRDFVESIELLMDPFRIAIRKLSKAYCLNCGDELPADMDGRKIFVEFNGRNKLIAAWACTSCQPLLKKGRKELANLGNDERPMVGSYLQFNGLNIDLIPSFVQAFLDVYLDEAPLWQLGLSANLSVEYSQRKGVAVIRPGSGAFTDSVFTPPNS